MTKTKHFSIGINKKDKGVAQVFGTLLFLILVLTIASALYVTLYGYNDNVQQATNIEAARVQEQIILSNLTLSDGYITGVEIDNIGSITSQIKAFYVDSSFICDPSDPMLNPNGAYIDSQTTQIINVQPVEYNPTSYITISTARGVKAIELESNLIGGSNSSFGSMETNYGPLRLHFEKFYYRDTDNAGNPMGPWQPGSNVSMTTSYCAWNITVTNIDIRNVTLNQYTCLNLVPNAPGLQAPAYINNTSLLIVSNQTVTIILVWNTPLPSTTATNVGKLSKNTAKVFLTCYGKFSDGTTYGQTIPFEAVIFVKSTPSITPPTLSPPSPVPYGTPVTASVTVSAPFGTQPTGYVDFQVSTDGGATFINFGTSKILTSSGTATSDPYVAPSTGNYQFRAVYLGDNNYVNITSSATQLTVIQASSTTTISLSQQLIPSGEPVTATATVTPGSTGTVRFEISTDNGATFTQLSINTLVSSIATSDPFTPETPGNNYRFRAIYEGDSNFLSSTSGEVTLTASGPLNHFDFDLINDQVAGVPFSITITAKDSDGFTVTNYTGSSALADSTGTIIPTVTGAFSAGIRTVSVSISMVDTDITISTSEGEASGTSNSFNVNPDVLDHFDFDLINDQVAGVPFSITITAHDAYNNIVTSYSGTNSLTDSSGSINPTSCTFLDGISTIPVTITNSIIGNTITTTGNGKGGTSNAFNVNPNVLDHFDFDLINNPQVANVSFSITITAHDAYNNIVTSYSGTNSLSDLSGSIDTTSCTFLNGIWTGPVTITNSIIGNTISTSGNGKGGNSNSFNVDVV